MADFKIEYQINKASKSTILEANEKHEAIEKFHVFLKEVIKEGDIIAIVSVSQIFTTNIDGYENLIKPKS